MPSDNIIIALITTLGLCYAARMQFGNRREIKEIHKETLETNTAVNHKEVGMPTLVQRVINKEELDNDLKVELLNFRDWQIEVLQKLAEKGHVEIPDPPVIKEK